MAKAGANGGHADGKTRKRKRKGTPIEPVNETATEAGNTKFARALASSDYSTRDKGLQVLTLWLKRRPNITDADLSKIWKGLFYAFWHADKAAVQARRLTEALAQRLAEILPQLSEEVALGYFRVFLATMRREWFGIDRLRLDKFMMLVRKFMQQTFVHLRNANWGEHRVETFMDTLAEEVLLKEDGSPALGLVYHLADCYTPELLAADSDEAVPEGALPLLVSPFMRLLADLRQPAGISRVIGSTFGPLLSACASSGDAGPGFASAQLLAGMARTAFELGAQAEVRTRNREALYSLSKQLQKAAKKFASSRPAAADDAAPHPAQPKQAAAAQPADAAAAARTTAAGGSAAGTPAAKRAAKKALSRMARASLAADAAAAADEMAQAVPSATVAASLEVDAAAAVPATPVSAKRAKRKKQQTGSQHMPAAGAVNGSAVSAEAGAGTGAKVHRTRSAANANGAVPPGSDATPGGAAVKYSRPRTASRLAAGIAAASVDRKSVHFRLKQNLHFDYGGPVPSPEVRTPPGARPKGPALRAQPATDPGHAASAASKRQKRQLVSPASIPRPKAAEFF